MSAQQPTLFPDEGIREAIAAAVARDFACYGQGSRPATNNATANSLAHLPPQFGFGVPVRDVVDTVINLYQRAQQRSR